MKKIIEMFRKSDIGEPPWEYSFLINLDEKEYPKYLSKIFKYRTGEDLPLKYDFGQQAWVVDKKRCKTFNQKLQWIKLYGVTQLMRDCTDKVKVRDYARPIIGEEYLKPVLQMVSASEVVSHENDNSDKKTPFDFIDFEKLPSAFVMKAGHGCKWQYIIKKKDEYLAEKKLVEVTRNRVNGWFNLDYSVWNGFELQYKGLEPKLLIEPLLREELNSYVQPIMVYAMNGNVTYTIKIHREGELTVYDENLNVIEDPFGFAEEKADIKADDLIKQAVELSKKLSKEFSFVRVDWMIYKGRIYFEELTFTPYSGFFRFPKELNEKFGKLIKIADCEQRLQGGWMTPARNAV